MRVAPVYRTLRAEFRHEIDPVKGSRFLTTVAPIADEAAAEAVLERVRAEFSHATHHCWAWRLGRDGARFRSSDDGEPGGSAGRPILQQLEGHEVTYAIAVVTRWFGGTKLGVGGLMRAYGGACGQTLDRAPITTVVVKVRLEVEHPYELSGPVQGLLAAWKLAPLDAAYDDHVRFVVEVPEDRAAEFERELTDRSAGQARVRE